MWPCPASNYLKTLSLSMVRITTLLLVYFTSLLLLLTQFPHSCHGKTAPPPRCSPSSCGNIRNISHPFRLTTDPKGCGDRRYKLSCENNATVVYLYKHRYYVESIDYDNFTVRLLHPALRAADCSPPLPLYSISILDFRCTDTYFSYKREWWDPNIDYPQLTTPLIFLTCAKPMDSPLFLNTPADLCISRRYSSQNTSTPSNSSSLSSSSSVFSYFRVGRLNASDVGDTCRIDVMAFTSSSAFNNNNLTLLEIRSALAYGFELSWFTCRNCTGKFRYSYNSFNDSLQCSDPDNLLNKVSVHPPVCHYFPYSWCGTHKWQVAITWCTRAVFLIIGPRILCGIPSIFIILICMLRRQHRSAFVDIEGYLESQNNLTPIRYSYSDIKKMTKGLKDKLGEGGYGFVYKGKLRSGHLVAVKILGKSKTNGQDFVNEVATIGWIHHVNVVQLVGYCAERSKRALVYDFMPNGSLEKHLISREEEGFVPLTWERKYEIALGVARGIEYLHRGCDMQILHFDIKPHNILLDENFVPKVSDFGLARLYPTDNSIVCLTAARGTIGYVAPELINRSIGDVSYKADVYSFGMLLVEIVGLRKNTTRTEENSTQYFPFWVYDQVKTDKEIGTEMEREMEIVAADEDHVEREITRKMTLVALWCIQTNPVNRPSMTKVVEMLEGGAELLQVPPEPFQSPLHASIMDQIWTTGNSTESTALLADPSDSMTRLDVI